jgi:dihydrofolate reductase
MRKLKLQVQITVDGFIGRENGELDFMTWNWDEQLKQYVQNITDQMDLIILGRKLAEGFIPYWAKVASDSQDPEYEAGKIFTETPKVVFSKTLQQPSSLWNNTRLAKGELAEEINNLKEQPGRDIIVYGGASFVASLARQGLIDEYNLFVNPVVIGKGLFIFNALGASQMLNRIDSVAFPCGITLLKYIPVH